MRFGIGMRRWCSTRVNPSTGIHVTGQGEYGFCNSECPNHETSKFPTHILYPNFLIEVIFHKKFYLSQAQQVRQPQQHHQQQQDLQ